jgi:hypothetical protein
MLKITIEKTVKFATFVAPNGIIYKSRIMHDEANGYDYVVDGNGESWLLNEIHFILVDEYTETEIIALADFEDFD